MKRKIGYLLLGALFASLLCVPMFASAQRKISELPLLSASPDSTDVMPIVDNATTKKVTLGNLKNYFNAGGGVAGWSLTGNSGTISSNFIGTTDFNPLILKVNNQTRAVFDNGGDISLLTGQTSVFSTLVLDKNGAFNLSANYNTGNTTLYGDTTDGIRIITNSVERMRFTQTGNVGIGTTTPAYELDVVGNQHLTGGVYFGTAGQYVSKGSYNFGGDGGISQYCSIGYEKMWQAGISYVFDNGGLIREARNCFNIIPDTSFDNLDRFKIGSRWVLDDGTTYVCTDASTGAAVWILLPSLPIGDPNRILFYNNLGNVSTSNNLVYSDTNFLAQTQNGNFRHTFFTNISGFTGFGINDTTNDQITGFGLNTDTQMVYNAGDKYIVYPKDTGSINDVMIVVSNDGNGITQLGWQEPVIKTAKVTIDSTQMSTADSAPIVVLPNPGSGKVYQLLGAIIKDNCVSCTAVGLSNCGLFYGTSSSRDGTPLIFFNSITDTGNFTYGGTQGNQANTNLNAENAQVVFSTIDGDMGSTDRSITVYVTYKVIEL